MSNIKDLGAARHTMFDFPPLPNQAGRIPAPGTKFGTPVFTTRQMREYGDACAAAAVAARWVPCAERMPERYAEVLAIAPSGGPLPWYWLARWNGFQWRASDDDLAIGTITHWCALPAPPKE
jgi:hypothetical protein